MTTQTETRLTGDAGTGAHQGETLLGIARAAIAGRFGLMLEHRDSDAFLAEPGASFVTLKHNGQLRGCIGSLQAHQSLLDDVRHNAEAAAFHDPRFSPLRADEYIQIQIEVSVLSPLTPLGAQDETSAIDQLRPGVDGVVLQCGNHRGTFLPQVWESLPEPKRFLAELKRKAGLAPEFWSDDVRLYRYHVDKWAENQHNDD
jgi:uncharacterized protein